MFNPLSNPNVITLIYNVLTKQYALEVQHVQGHVSLVLGGPRTAAEFMKANKIDHFDYDNSIYDGDTFDNFKNAAADLDFEI